MVALVRPLTAASSGIIFATMNAPTRMSGVEIDGAVVAEAEALGVDVVRACEAGLRAEIKRAADARWIEENRPAMDAWNDWLEENRPAVEASNRWVEEHGLPLAKYRLF
jgi:antitoxin CcdA